MINVYITWFLGLPILFMTISRLFRLYNVIPGTTKKGGNSNDLMAFELVAFFCVSYISATSWYAYIMGPLEALSSDKFYGRSIFVEEHILCPMLIYQFWNFVISIFNKDLNDPFMLGHHFFAGFLSYLGHAPYMHYYSILFSMVELTNIPLTIVDIFKKFPKFREDYEYVNSISRVTFALSFIGLRMIMWPMFAIPFCKDSIKLLLSGNQHSTFVVLYVLLSIGFLTFLQFFWGQKIIGFLHVDLADVGLKAKKII